MNVRKRKKKKMINRNRSKAMREAWVRRKAKTATEGQPMPRENVVKAVSLAKELVEVCDGDSEFARELIQ